MLCRRLLHREQGLHRDGIRWFINIYKDFWEYDPSAAADIIPDQFTFTDQWNATLSTVITSNTITVSGINTAAPISITGGTYAINGGSYTSTSGTVNNGNTVTVRVASSGSYSTTTNATLTIGGVSDTFSVTTQSAPPTAGSFQFSLSTYSVNENGGSVTITVTRTGGSNGAVGVSYATSNGTATAGSDYTSTSGTLSWADGDTSSKTFSIPILDDSAYETDETVNLTLSSPTGGATLGSPSTAVLTIIDNDAVSFVTSADSVTVPEGGTATFQVKLSAQPSSTVYASVSRVSGDSDISVQSGSSLTFTSTNWNSYQTVTLSAAEDADTTNGTATIRISASGIPNKDITATESDNDRSYFSLADYDGDGATDVAAFHLPTDQFFTDYAGNLGQFGWGGSDSMPLVWDYDGDGKTDVSIYHIPTNQWFVKGVGNLGQFGWGGEESVPVPGDYNGDGRMERAFYHSPTNRWFVEGQDPVPLVGMEQSVSQSLETMMGMEKRIW